MKKIFSAFVPFLVVGVVLTAAFFLFGKEETPDTKTADLAYVARNYQQAISIYEANRSSLDKNQLVNLGDAYFKTGQSDKALSLYSEMERNKELTGEYLSEFYLRMAGEAAKADDVETATIYYQKSIDLAQSMSLQLRSKKEYGYFASERPYADGAEIALSYLKEVAKQPTEEFNYEIAYHLGNLSYQAGEYQGAMDYWQRVIALNHQFVPAYEKIGILQLDTKNYQEALKTFQKALTYDTSNWRAYFGIAEAYASSGNELLATENYRKTLSFNPDHFPSHYQLAEQALERGEKNKALEHYYTIYQKSPDSELGKLAKEALEKHAPSARTDSFE